MPIYKEVWNFRSNTGGTWSDVFYSEAAALADAANFGNAFINKRLALLHPLNTFTKIRVSEDQNPRVSTIVNINRKGTGNYGIDPDNPPGPSNLGEAAVVTLASSAVAASRKWWLRGMPENGVSRLNETGEDYLAPKFAEALDSFLNTIARPNTTYIVHKISPAGQNQVVSVDVTRVDGSAANGFSILTCTAPPLVIQGNQIILSQFNPKDFPGLNGTFTVKAVNGNNVTIPYVTPESANLIPLTGKAKKRVVVPGAKLTRSLCGFSFLGTRQTKNPATGSRGAKRAVRIRVLA